MFYQHGEVWAVKRQRVTTVLDPEIVTAVRALAIERGAALSRLIEEAIREYLADRPAGTDVDLLARMPRRTGRPSRLERVGEARRRAELRKRGGRPLRRREASDETQS